MVDPSDDSKRARRESVADNGSAPARLKQLSSHLDSSSNSEESAPSPASAPNSTIPKSSEAERCPPHRRKPSSQISALPPDYSDILSQLSKIRSLAATPDLKSRGYISHKTSGKLWVRERIAALLDKDSFYEIGSVAGSVTWASSSSSPSQDGKIDEPVAFTPTNNINGFGRLGGRPVLLTVDDFSVRAGHADGAIMEKTAWVERMAVKLKVPILKLVDGSSGGGSVTTIKRDGWSYLPSVPFLRDTVKGLNMGVPNLGAVLGPAVGLGAARVVICHFSVMAGNIGSLFNAGPAIVENATFEEGLSLTDLGGPAMHCTNGTIDNLAANEEECFKQIRTVLGYLPNSGAEAPPVVQCDDPEQREEIDLRSVIPRRKARSYDARKIIRLIADRESWFEIGALWGRTAITGLARLGGRPIGVISLNCEVNGGALDAGGSQKLTRLLKLCDVFNLPIVQFLDIPGYAIGTAAERAATMRWGIELAKAYFTTTTPILSVVTRRVFGVAGNVMLDSRDPMMRFAWPSGQWGSLPLEGGIEVGHRHELKEAEKEGRRDDVYKSLETEYQRLMNPVRTAARFGVEEIIDPKDTRKICCTWASMAYATLMRERLSDRALGKIHPQFA
ncbi:MAG: hypothetical protein Q9160_003298 [Pyrenula sp. 1 TL-2023]